jgi:hypothetical protein
LFIKKLGGKASQGELAEAQDWSINDRNIKMTFNRSLDVGCENKA